MSSWVYEGDELTCFCFQSQQAKNSHGLKCNEQQGFGQWDHRRRSSEQKLKSEEGRKGKKSLKRNKMKREEVQSLNESQNTGDKQQLIRQLKTQAMRSKPDSKPEWNDYHPNNDIYPNNKNQPQNKHQKRFSNFRNAPHKINTETLQYYPPNVFQPSQKPVNSTIHTSVPKNAFYQNNSNYLTVDRCLEKDSNIMPKHKYRKSFQGLEKKHKIYPRQIQSVIDENQYEQDRVSVVIERGWGGIEQRSKYKGSKNGQTLNTMTSHMKNSQIKYSLFGFNQNHFTYY